MDIIIRVRRASSEEAVERLDAAERSENEG
jgi:hypothetical protein